MRRKLFSLLAAGALLALPGCSLAQPEAGDQGRPQLVGVFITAEPLDQLEGDGVLAGRSGPAGDGAAYEMRFYATLVEDEWGGQYRFEGVPGYGFFVSNVTFADGMQGWTNFGEDISDSRIQVNVGDGGTGIDLEGTLYVDAGQTGNRVYHFNPVYQQAEGAVYTTSGSAVSADFSEEGTSMTQTLAETYTATQNGGTGEVTNRVEVHVTSVRAPEKLTLMELDGQNKLIRCTEYQPGALPETLRPSAAAAYLILEVQKTDGTVERTLYNRGEPELSALCAAEGGICVKRLTALEW